MKAIGISPGIGIGNAYVIWRNEVSVATARSDDSNKEIERLSLAVEQGISELEKLMEKAGDKADGKASDIFFSHQMILEDPEIIGRVEEMIRRDKVGAAYAVKEVSLEFVKSFEAMNNNYLKERAADIRETTDMLLRILDGREVFGLECIPENSIVFAEELTPKETVFMDKEKIMGIVTEKGGVTSHVAILAKAMGIPAVTGAEGVLNTISVGDEVVVDGNEGSVYINPDEATKAEYRKKLAILNEKKEMLKKAAKIPLVTTDGCRVFLEANAGGIEDIIAAEENGCDGIGLFRTEFLFIGADRIPSEEEQFGLYRQATEKMKGKKTVFRTLDVGGDKDIPCLDIPKEENPFLGFRAIRFCLKEKQVFRTQLRALLRASAFGNVSIMFPMISSVVEIQEAKAALEQAKRELVEEKVLFDEKIRIGIMIEIPSAAIMSDLLAKEVDFFSIGTNDLIQYTLAADRLNAKVGYLYSPFNPAVLRLVKLVIDNAHKNGVLVAMCGEAAAEPELIPLLTGMGLDEFSVSPGSLLTARETVAKCSRQCMSEHIEKVLALGSAEDVRYYLRENVCSCLAREPNGI